ncbi:MAG: pyrroline-5-carboxylate reductase [Sulfobacillus acidophilus]|uniref:Pyrroline-5-carboxylate reductase n=1 Tax=Sulfobacillus acidophilus TaxID=53633 RepID=A0A2T2WFR0_9FIRM|nr:MAG: pyrroline-5-carboxylate reductase [Sulfobacillus acidophilus]
MQRIVIVGSGHLAHALWEGWHRNPREPRVIDLVARSEAHRALWNPRVWDTVSFSPEIVGSADVVVLTVKPKDTEASVGQLRPYLGVRTVLVSPVAGWSIAQFRDLGVQGPIARIMPNVSAAIGASTTLATFDGLASERRRAIEAFLSECGQVTVVDESLINPYTALIGSGPAYIFLLLKALIEGGERLGTDAAMTRQLVSSMVEGAARLARDRSEESLDDWIGQVASPGGTTEALLRVLDREGWPSMIQDAVVAASRRAEELGVRH